MDPTHRRVPRWRRAIIWLLPAPLLVAPCLIFLGPGFIGPRLLAFLIFPGALLMWGSLPLGLAFSGLFYYFSVVALLAMLLRPRTHLTRWWHIGQPAWALIALGLLALFIAHCHANWNPD